MRAMPLHQFTSPNGKGLCTYVSSGNVCGRPGVAVEHLAARLAGGQPPDPVADYLAEKADAAYETYHGASFPVDDPPTTAQVVAMFHDQALRLAVAKDQAYRKAWVEQGYIGNVGRILSKASRLRAMVWGEVDLNFEEDSKEAESVRDTLLDMANLCAFAAHNMAADNRWGGPRG